MEDKIAGALRVLNIAYEEIWKRRVGEQRSMQFMRYNGLKDMFEILTGDKIVLTREGKHEVIVDEKGDIKND